MHPNSQVTSLRLMWSPCTCSRFWQRISYPWKGWSLWSPWMYKAPSLSSAGMVSVLKSLFMMFMAVQHFTTDGVYIVQDPNPWKVDPGRKFTTLIFMKFGPMVPNFIEIISGCRIHKNWKCVHQWALKDLSHNMVLLGDFSYHIDPFILRTYKSKDYKSQTFLLWNLNPWVQISF